MEVVGKKNIGKKIAKWTGISFGILFLEGPNFFPLLELSPFFI